MRKQIYMNSLAGILIADIIWQLYENMEMQE